MLLQASDKAAEQAACESRPKSPHQRKGTLNKSQTSLARSNHKSMGEMLVQSHVIENSDALHFKIGLSNLTQSAQRVSTVDLGRYHGALQEHPE